MAQESNIAIIGAGASGCIAAYFLQKAGFDVTIFDKGMPLRTLLPTGGGRCNLAHAEYDFMELAKNYPRGEKFLYSVFSQFSTYDTLALFEELSIETYTQEDERIFPTSNSAKYVREKILTKIHNYKIEAVTSLEQISGGFKLVTKSTKGSNSYFFEYVIIAIGGHSDFAFLKDFDIKIVPPKPSLVGLNTKEKSSELSGIVIKNATTMGLVGDILFTHFGISGPLVYKISSIKARDEFPYNLTFDLYTSDFDLQDLLNRNSHKDLKNILSKFLPIGFIKHTFGDIAEVKAHKIDGKTRDWILDKIHNYKLTVVGTNKGEETVTAGGIDLKEVEPKTMQLKKHPKLFCIGEALDIDGFCGGYNLQNAWSTAYVAANAIISSAK